MITIKILAILIFGGYLAYLGYTLDTIEFWVLLILVTTISVIPWGI